MNLVLREFQPQRPTDPSPGKASGPDQTELIAGLLWLYGSREPQPRSATWLATLTPESNRGLLGQAGPEDVDLGQAGPCQVKGEASHLSLHFRPSLLSPLNPAFSWASQSLEGLGAAPLLC